MAVAKSELPAGARKIVTVGRREVVVLNVDGEFHALFNRCPHRQAPLSAGEVRNGRKATEVGQIEYDPETRVLLCPWHRYEYDLTSGRCAADPKGLRVGTYSVVEEGDEIAVYV